MCAWAQTRLATTYLPSIWSTTTSLSVSKYKQSKSSSKCNNTARSSVETFVSSPHPSSKHWEREGTRAALLFNSVPIRVSLPSAVSVLSCSCSLVKIDHHRSKWEEGEGVGGGGGGICVALLVLLAVTPWPPQRLLNSAKCQCLSLFAHALSFHSRQATAASSSSEGPSIIMAVRPLCIQVGFGFSFFLFSVQFHSFT